jgi:hypothetical protein
MRLWRFNTGGMQMSRLQLTSLAIAIILLGALPCRYATSAAETPKTAPDKTAKEVSAVAKDTTGIVRHAYVGVGKCKMCHMPYFKAWSETDHAEAFTLLKAEKNEDKNKKCLKCHTTGFGRGGYALGEKAPDFRGVQCEACHGPGADYMKVMKDEAKARAAGLVYPVPESVCIGCHNKESPAFKAFDYKTALAKGVHKVKKEAEK